MHAADRAVRKRRKREDRENALQKLITDSSGLVATGVLLDDLIEKHQEFGVEKPDEDRIAELKRKWLCRVTQAAADSSLAEVENMERVLRRWEKWGDPGEVQKWRNDLKAFPEGILRLLKSYISQSSTSYGDGRHKSICWISWQNLEEIAELQVWEGYNNALSENEPEIGENDTAKLLRESLQRWANQSPDKTRSHLDDDEDDN